MGLRRTRARKLRYNYPLLTICKTDTVYVFYITLWPSSFFFLKFWHFQKKKCDDVVKPFFTWNNSINLKNEHSNNIEKNRNKNRNFFYSILCILSIQICECYLLSSTWGTRASYSETSCDCFFLVFFFNPTDRPTQYQETHLTLNEKKGGWPMCKRMLFKNWFKALTPRLS